MDASGCLRWCIPGGKVRFRYKNHGEKIWHRENLLSKIEDNGEAGLASALKDTAIISLTRIGEIVDRNEIPDHFFGMTGGNGELFGDLWEFDGMQWTRPSAGESGPSPWKDGAMVYDLTRQTFLLFGGDAGGRSLDIGRGCMGRSCIRPGSPASTRLEAASTSAGIRIAP